MSAFATAFHDLLLGPSLARSHQEWVARFPDEDIRIDCCPDCGGDGGFEAVTGSNPYDGEPTGYIAECTTCCGKGEAVFPVFPIDEDDLADMCGDCEMPEPVGDGRYCRHHDDDPAHDARCYSQPTESQFQQGDGK